MWDGSIARNISASFVASNVASSTSVFIAEATALHSWFVAVFAKNMFRCVRLYPGSIETDNKVLPPSRDTVKIAKLVERPESMLSSDQEWKHSTFFSGPFVRAIYLWEINVPSRPKSMPASSTWQAFPIVLWRSTDRHDWSQSRLRPQLGAQARYADEPRPEEESWVDRSGRV